MRTKSRVKRLSALLVCLATAVSLHLSVFSGSVSAEVLDTDYVIYSGDGILVNTNQAVINGNVFSGSDLTFTGQETCFINRSLNAAKTGGTVRALQTESGRAEMPDYTAKLRSGFAYEQFFSGDAELSAAEYDLSGSVRSTGRLHLDRTPLRGKGCVRAKGDIQYDAVKNADDSAAIFYSEDGNITVQGTKLVLNGIFYAPNGTVELNAKELTVNGAIVAKKVELNGTRLTVNEMGSEYTSLVDFSPDILIEGLEDSYKENRKIALDITQSAAEKHLDTDSLVWTFSADDPAQQACIRTDDASATPTARNLVITEAGIYRLQITGRDSAGNDVRYYETLNITEDQPPVAGFRRDRDETVRNADGVAEISLEDTSYSPDGDQIGSRIWSVYFDSDNDGDFSDEEEQVFSIGNETAVTYAAESVGRYRFRLAVAELFTDTIPALISDQAYLTATTDGMTAQAAETEVVNEAPKSYSGIRKAKNIDIVATVGNVDSDDIRTLNRELDQVKAELEDKGYSVQLSTASTSTLTARDTFAWDEYDHYNYADSYLPTLEKHILYEEDSIRMVGYSWAPLRDWLFVDDGVKAKRILSFDMVRDRTDWHSMEGGGFLFNTSIFEEETGETDENGERKTVKLLDGYCILLTSGGFKLIQLDRVDLNQFRDGGINGNVQYIGKVLASVGVRDVYADYHVRIDAGSRLLSVYINDEKLIDNFVLPDTGKGTGFGPIICHASHGCSQQSYFTFSNIKMTTVNGEELSDVLNHHPWRPSAERFVLNFSKESLFDLNDQRSVGTAVKSLIENRTHFIGLGTAESRQQYTMLLKSADGVYTDWYDLMKEPSLLRNYILNTVSGISYDVGDTVLTTDELVYENSFRDPENDPVGTQKWRYTLDAGVYENSSRKSGVYDYPEPLAALDASGLYSIRSVVQDDPTGGNAALNGYQKWSNEVQWTEGLYAHNKPAAQIQSELLTTDAANRFLCRLTFDAEDIDCLSHKNRGIAEEAFSWKRVDDTAWTDGRMPELIDAGGTYLQQYRVLDEQGAWSDPCVELICAEKQENTEQFTDTENPKITLTVSDPAPSVGDQILISVSASDNTEIAYVKTAVNGRTVCQYQGSFLYECTEEGDLVITAECADIARNPASESMTVTVTDRRDLTPPVIAVDPEQDITLDDLRLTVSGSVYDETALSAYTVQYAKAGSEEYSEVCESAKAVYQGELASVTLPESNASYEILIEAKDAAGNTAYCKLTVTVTETGAEAGETEHRTEIPDPPVPADPVDVPAVITIEASAETAEVGDIVQVTVSAEDENGLISVLVFKNDEQIADSPCSFRFSEAEAGTAVIRAETVDADGFTAQKSLEIVFEDHSDRTPPTAEITAPAENAEVSGKYSVCGSAFDETGLRNYTLAYRRTGGSAFTPILTAVSARRGAELGVWDTYALDNGSYELRLTVTDNGGNTVTVTQPCTVQNGAVSTAEQLAEDLIVFSKPEPGTVADEVIRIDAKADSSLANGSYQISIQPKNGSGEMLPVKDGKIGSDGAISATVRSDGMDDGDYTVVIAAVRDEVSVRQVSDVRISHGRQELAEDAACTIVTPEDDERMTWKERVYATVTPEKFTRYKIEYAPVGTDRYVLCDSGSLREDASDLTGSFDTTVTENGFYTLRLTVYGEQYTASDTVTVQVMNNMQSGVFSLSFRDLDFRLNGIPVTVLRTYDSRNRRTQGEFGYGWAMTYDNVKLSINTNQSKNWTEEATRSSFIASYSLTETKSHRITVDLGNGSSEEFRMCISPEKQAFFPIQYGVSVSYVPCGDTGSTLVPLDLDPNDLLFLDDTLMTFELESFNPRQFLYTTADGTQYRIDASSGLMSLTTADGDTIWFRKDGITASNGCSITYQYDGAGRITKVQNSFGQSVSYEYDVFGDLCAVTDVSGSQVRFVYQNHYLTELINPDGVPVGRNEYDENGRLVKVVDANGNEQTFELDVDGQEEIITDRNGGVTRLVYDAGGNVISRTDANGNTVTSLYDESNHEIRRTDAMGNVTEFTYDANGRELTRTDAEGYVIETGYQTGGAVTSVKLGDTVALRASYNRKGAVASVTDAGGFVTAYDYTANGKLKSVTDDIGEYLNLTYDKNGNVISAVNGAGETETFTYDKQDRCLSKTLNFTSDGQRVTATELYDYDESGRLIRITDSEGRVSSKEYNALGQLVSETDESGAQTRYTYDNLGNTTRIAYADGTAETFTYDNEGNNLTATDRYGRTVTMTYDKVGNLLTRTDADGSTVSYEYDKNYRLIAETDADGGVTAYTYDKAGRSTSVTAPDGGTTTYTYNELSLVESVTDENGGICRYTYDEAGNRSGITFPDGSSMHTAYDARGRITAQTDQNGYVTAYTYDGADHLTAVTDALGGVTRYTYDEIGNLATVTDANGNTTAYAYDAFGRVVKTTDAAGNSSEKTYDESGNILTETDFGGKLITYTYDAAGRLASRTTADGTVSYSYTASDCLAAVSTPAGTTRFTYDGSGGLTRIDYPDGTFAAYSYDGSGRIGAVQTPFGTTSYGYDAADRPVQITDQNGAGASYVYDKNGNRTEIRYTNGITVRYVYDKMNRLTAEKVLYQNGTVLEEYRYTLGKAGEILRIEEQSGRTVQYAYDKLYRVTDETVSLNGVSVRHDSYTYDKVGNRLTRTTGSSKTAYKYNALNQLVSENSTKYQYDKAGNLISVSGNGSASLYVYDAENRMVQATVQNGDRQITESYTYDYAGNRTAKIGSDGEIRYLNDPTGDLTQVLAEYDQNRNLLCAYIRGDQPVAQRRNNAYSFFLCDGHGSVRMLADAAGTVTDTYAYDAWGNLSDASGSTENSLRYCGEAYDAATELYYLRARYMDTGTGTFTALDTYQGGLMQPESQHKYLYAQANPVKYIDPSGHMAAAVAVGGMMNSLLRSEDFQRCMATFHTLCAQLEAAFMTWLSANFVNIIATAMITCMVISAAHTIRQTVVSGSLSGTRSTALGDITAGDILIAQAIVIAAEELIELGKNYSGKVIHHIVAMKDRRAKPARDVLDKVGISVCATHVTSVLRRLCLTDLEPNLVEISALTHRAIHSMPVQSGYYEWVNVLITGTPHDTGIKLVDKLNVAGMLYFIKGIIKAADHFISPMALP